MLVKLTLAPGTAAPDTSATVPFSAAVATCAGVGLGDSKNQMIATTDRRVAACREDDFREGRQVMAASPRAYEFEQIGALRVEKDLKHPGTVHGTHLGRNLFSRSESNIQY